MPKVKKPPTQLQLFQLSFAELKKNKRLFGSIWLGMMMSIMTIYIILGLMRNLVYNYKIPLLELQLIIAVAALCSILMIPIMRFTARQSSEWYVYRWGVMLAAIGATLCMMTVNTVQLAVGIIIAVGIGPAALITAPWDELKKKISPETKEMVYGLFFMAYPIGSLIGMSVAGLFATFFSWKLSFFVIVALSYAITELARREFKDTDPLYQTFMDKIVKVLFFISIAMSVVLTILYTLSPFLSERQFLNAALEFVVRFGTPLLYGAVGLFLVIFFGSIAFSRWNNRFKTDTASFAFFKTPHYMRRLTIFSIVTFIASGYCFILFYFVQFGWQVTFIRSYFYIAPYFIAMIAGILAMVIMDKAQFRREFSVWGIVIFTSGLLVTGLSMIGDSYGMFFVGIILAGFGSGVTLDQLSRVVNFSLKELSLGVSIQQRVNDLFNIISIALVGFLVTTSAVIIFQNTTGYQAQSTYKASAVLSLISYDEAIKITESKDVKDPEAALQALADASKQSSVFFTLFLTFAMAIVGMYVIKGKSTKTILCRST